MSHFLFPPLPSPPFLGSNHLYDRLSSPKRGEVWYEPEVNIYIFPQKYKYLPDLFDRLVSFPFPLLLWDIWLEKHNRAYTEGEMSYKEIWDIIK